MLAVTFAIKAFREVWGRRITFMCGGIIWCSETSSIKKITLRGEREKRSTSISFENTDKHVD